RDTGSAGRGSRPTRARSWRVPGASSSASGPAPRRASPGKASRPGPRAGGRRAGLALWLAFAAQKVVGTVLFFGYARQGAVVIPVVAVLCALALERPIAGWPPGRGWRGLPATGR